MTVVPSNVVELYLIYYYIASHKYLICVDCLVVLTTSKQQAKYKEVTGKDFGPPPKEKKEKQKPQEQQAPSAKNAEKKAAKVCTHFAFHYLLCVCMCCAIHYVT